MSDVVVERGLPAVLAKLPNEVDETHWEAALAALQPVSSWQTDPKKVVPLATGLQIISLLVAGRLLFSFFRGDRLVPFDVNGYVRTVALFATSGLFAGCVVWKKQVAGNDVQRRLEKLQERVATYSMYSSDLDALSGEAAAVVLRGEMNRLETPAHYLAFLNSKPESVLTNFPHAVSDAFKKDLLVAFTDAGHFTLPDGLAVTDSDVADYLVQEANVLSLNDFQDKYGDRWSTCGEADRVQQAINARVAQVLTDRPCFDDIAVVDVGMPAVMDYLADEAAQLSLVQFRQRHGVKWLEKEGAKAVQAALKQRLLREQLPGKRLPQARAMFGRQVQECRIESVWNEWLSQEADGTFLEYVRKHGAPTDDRLRLKLQGKLRQELAGKSYIEMQQQGYVNAADTCRMSAEIGQSLAGQARGETTYQAFMQRHGTDWVASHNRTVGPALVNKLNAYLFREKPPLHEVRTNPLVATGIFNAQLQSYVLREAGRQDQTVDQFFQRHQVDLANALFTNRVAIANQLFNRLQLSELGYRNLSDATKQLIETQRLRDRVATAIMGEQGCTLSELIAKHGDDFINWGVVTDARLVARLNDDLRRHMPENRERFDEIAAEVPQRLITGAANLRNGWFVQLHDRIGPVHMYRRYGERAWGLMQQPLNADVSFATLQAVFGDRANEVNRTNERFGSAVADLAWNGEAKAREMHSAEVVAQTLTDLQQLRQQYTMAVTAVTSGRANTETGRAYRIVRAHCPERQEDMELWALVKAADLPIENSYFQPTRHDFENLLAFVPERDIPSVRNDRIVWVSQRAQLEEAVAEDLYSFADMAQILTSLGGPIEYDNEPWVLFDRFRQICQDCQTGGRVPANLTEEQQRMPRQIFALAARAMSVEGYAKGQSCQMVSNAVRKFSAHFYNQVPGDGDQSPLDAAQEVVSTLQVMLSELGEVEGESNFTDAQMHALLQQAATADADGFTNTPLMVTANEHHLQQLRRQYNADN